MNFYALLQYREFWLLLLVVLLQITRLPNRGHQHARFCFLRVMGWKLPIYPISLDSPRPLLSSATSVLRFWCCPCLLRVSASPR